MRYRPFRASGASISAVSLAPTDTRMSDHDRDELYQAALIAGVNAYELRAEDATAQAMLGDALRSYDRSLVMVSVRVGMAEGGARSDFSASEIMRQVEQATRRLDLGVLDLITLDNPGVEDLTPSLVSALREAHAVGMFGAIGVRAEGEAAVQLVRCGAFKVLYTRFNLLSGWPERNLIRSAIDRGMTVVGYGFHGGELQAAESGPTPRVLPWKGLLGLGRRKAQTDLSKTHGYAFLQQTKGWSDEAICLAYALTEPALATVQVAPRSPEHLKELAAVPERDLPSHLSAQIEMARFSAVA